MKTEAVKVRAYRSGQVAVLDRADSSSETTFAWAPAMDTKNPILVYARAGEAARAGRLADAQQLYREAIRMTARMFDAHHPQLATVAHGLVLLFARRGMHDAERRLSAKIVDRVDRKRAVSANGRTVSRLADLYRRAGRSEEGLDLYREALAHCRRTYGDGHHRVVECLARFARFEKLVGNSEQAGALLREAIAMLDELDDPVNRNVIHIVSAARDHIAPAD